MIKEQSLNTRGVIFLLTDKAKAKSAQMKLISVLNQAYRQLVSDISLF